MRACAVDGGTAGVGLVRQQAVGVTGRRADGRSGAGRAPYKIGRVVAILDGPGEGGDCDGGGRLRWGTAG
ncbi:hypothetical protein GCM10010247_38860 [Streptomyces calvus]|nr:hypothetical protein GCM10010247_38860 [Streptomyces calvus]